MNKGPSILVSLTSWYQKQWQFSKLEDISIRKKYKTRNLEFWSKFTFLLEQQVKFVFKATQAEMPSDVFYVFHT